MATATQAVAGQTADVLRATNAAMRAVPGSVKQGKAKAALTLAQRVAANRAARAAKAATKPAAKAAKAGAKAVKPRAGWKLGTPKLANGRTGDNPCACGCGTKVGGTFAQGHDARVHSWLLAVERGERTKASLPDETRKALASGRIRAHGTKASSPKLLVA